MQPCRKVHSQNPEPPFLIPAGGNRGPFLELHEYGFHQTSQGHHEWATGYPDRCGRSLCGAQAGLAQAQQGFPALDQILLQGSHGQGMTRHGHIIGVGLPAAMLKQSRQLFKLVPDGFSSAFWKHLRPALDPPQRGCHGSHKFAMPVEFTLSLGAQPQQFTLLFGLAQSPLVERGLPDSHGTQPHESLENRQVEPAEGTSLRFPIEVQGPMDLALVHHGCAQQRPPVKFHKAQTSESGVRKGLVGHDCGPLPGHILQDGSREADAFLHIAHAMGGAPSPLLRFHHEEPAIPIQEKEGLLQQPLHQVVGIHLPQQLLRGALQQFDAPDQHHGLGRFRRDILEEIPHPLRKGGAIETRESIREGQMPTAHHQFIPVLEGIALRVIEWLIIQEGAVGGV